MMSSEIARRFISNYLSEYFLNLNSKTLSLSLWSGYLNCENLKLNPQKFNENKNFPIHLKDGLISKINMSLPIKSFFFGINNEIEISIEDVEIDLVTNSSFEFFDYTNFDYKSNFVKEITNDLLFKMELSKNPNITDTYFTRSITYILANMNISIKNINIKLIHEPNSSYNNIFGINIDRINLKKDYFSIFNFFIFIQNSINSNRSPYFGTMKKMEQEYLLFPVSLKSKIITIQKSQNEIDEKEKSLISDKKNENDNNEQKENEKVNDEKIDTYSIEFNISDINIAINKSQFISIMNLLNFFIDYKTYYNNCYILRKIQYEKPAKDCEKYSLKLFKHYIRGIILVMKEKKYGFDVFDYYKNNDANKNIFFKKFNEYFFENKIDNELTNIIRFTDEKILKSWIKENCENIFKYKNESARGFFGGIKSYFFSSAIESLKSYNIEEVSNKYKIICEFKGKINIITLSLKYHNEESKLCLQESDIEFYRGKVSNILEIFIGKIKLNFIHIINKSIFTKEIILPLSTNNDNKKNSNNKISDDMKEIYIKYIFKKFIPKSTDERSNLYVRCTSHFLIYNQSMFHSLYQFLYKDVYLMKNNFTQYKLLKAITWYKFNKDSVVYLDINIANHKLIFPYLNYYLSSNCFNEEKLEVNLGDVEIKSSDKYDILVENINIDFIDKNQIIHQIIKNFNFKLSSSFDFNLNNFSFSNIDIQFSLNLLENLLYNTKDIFTRTQPEEIWRIKVKNKCQLFNNSIKRGLIYCKIKNRGWLKFYSLISGGYIFLFEKSGNPSPDFLIPLYDSYIEEIEDNNNDDYDSNFKYKFNIYFKNEKKNLTSNKKYEIGFKEKKTMIEWKKAINYRIEEINQSILKININKKRKLSSGSVKSGSTNNNHKPDISSNNNLDINKNLILEESKRIRSNIINKGENNQQKKLRLFSEQISKFIHSEKGNRQTNIEISNISISINYSENDNYNKGLKIIFNNTKSEYSDNNIFLFLRTYIGNIQLISNNLNLIRVNETIENNFFVNINLLSCFNSAYNILEKHRDEINKLIPNIQKQEEIKEFITKLQSNQVKLNILKELDIFFEPEEIFTNIKLIKNVSKKIKKKINESLHLINKLNFCLNTEKNISFIYVDELTKNKYYIIIQQIKSKDHQTIIKNINVVFHDKISNNDNNLNKESNKKVVVKEFDIIINKIFQLNKNKTNYNNLYKIEFSKEIFCCLYKIDYDNICNIISKIIFSVKNNFIKNTFLSQFQNDNVKKNNKNINNDIINIFDIKIQKIQCLFHVGSIFGSKNENKILLDVDNMNITYQRSKYFNSEIGKFVVIKQLDNNDKLILVDMINSFNISYENNKIEKKKLLYIILDKIIINLQYDLLYDCINFFINIKYDHIYINDSKNELNSFLASNNNEIIDSSNNTILTLNNPNTLNSNNIKNNNNDHNNKNISETSSEFQSIQLIPLLNIDLSLNDIQIKIPFELRQQQNSINDKMKYLCLEFISLIIKYKTDLLWNDKSIPCNQYFRIQSPQNKIYILSQDNNIFTNILIKSSPFYLEIKYNYYINQVIFIPQKKYSVYCIIPENIELSMNFEDMKKIINLFIDIKNYYRESKLTYFTYCYLSEPDIYTTVKTLFLEISGHISQKFCIRIEEFFEIILKKSHISYKDLSKDNKNKEINIIFTLILNYYNRKLKIYEYFLEPYNFKFISLNNIFKFGSNDKNELDVIDKKLSKNKLLNDNIINCSSNSNLNLKNIKNSKNKLDKNLIFEDENNDIIYNKSNPNGLSLNVTEDLLDVINNIYDIAMLYKKCHVLQNTDVKNNLNLKENKKIILYNYTNDIVTINQKNVINPGVFLNIQSNEEEFYEIKFNKNNIQFNDIKFNELQNVLIYNKIYFHKEENEDIEKLYFYCPIIMQNFCEKDIIISNKTNKEEITLVQKQILGIDFNNFINKNINIKLYENNNNIFVNLTQSLVEKIKITLKDNEINEKIIIQDYFTFKFKFIGKNNNNVLKVEIYPRYIIHNTLDIPIIFSYLPTEDNISKIEISLKSDGTPTDVYLPDMPKINFKLKLIDSKNNETKEFISDTTILDNNYYDNNLNYKNNFDFISNDLENEIINRKIILIKGKLKIRFSESEDILIKLIYFILPETYQLKMYLYMDYFILNNTKLNIFPLNNCISFKDKNFMVNYYPIRNYKNFQLVVGDKILEKFEIKKEDYAFFTHVEVEVIKDKKINLLIQRHLRYFKFDEKLYKIDFLIISQIQKHNINNDNNINNIIVASNQINKSKDIYEDNVNDINNCINDDDILMKLVKQRNLIDIPQVTSLEHNFSLEINFPAVFITLIKNNTVNNIINSRYEIADVYLNNIDFNYNQQKINLENSKEQENVLNLNNNENEKEVDSFIIDYIDNKKNTNLISNDVILNKNFDDMEEIYSNSVELVIQSIQIDNLLENAIYKIIFYNKHQEKKFLSSFNEFDIHNDKNNLNKKNKLLPFIHFKGSFINQEYKYYFSEINICFLPCYLYLDSEFSTELLDLVLKSYNIIKNKTFYFRSSIVEIIDSLSFNLDSNFTSKFFMFIASFKISPLTIFFNYKNFSNRFFNLLNLQNNLINTLLDVFTNNTTCINFHFNSIKLYDINVRLNALIYKLYDYYYYTFLRESIKILFSVDILGDPYHLLSHLSDGISNFITLPILNILNGPSDFIFYFLYGTKSLLSNSIGGLLDSVHKLANSLSKNILKLTNSEEYIQSRNKILIKENYLDGNLVKHPNSKKINPMGIQNIFLLMKILINGLKIGVKDVIYIPYKYYKTKGIIEIPIGAILGTISLVIKPMSAVMDSISLFSDIVSHEILKGEKNFDEDYLYYSYNRMRHRRENVFESNLDVENNKIKKIKKYKEENIDILMKLIGDGINIDNEIERGIINRMYKIKKIFISKIDECKYKIIVFIKNSKNKEYSIMIYNVNLIKKSNTTSLELFTKANNEKNNMNITTNLRNIIPLKNIISVNLDDDNNKVNICYRVKNNNQEQKLNKNLINSMIKYNFYASFYSFIYGNNALNNIIIQFSSHYILHEFLIYYNKKKFNITIQNKENIENKKI